MLKGTLENVNCNKRTVGNQEITECTGEQGFKVKSDGVRVVALPPCFQPSLSTKDGTCQRPITNFFSKTVSRWKQAICTFRIEKRTDQNTGGTWIMICSKNPVTAAENVAGEKTPVDTTPKPETPVTTRPTNKGSRWIEINLDEAEPKIREVPPK